MSDQTTDSPSDSINQPALREEVRAVMGGDKLSQAAAARDAGVAGSTFAAWLNATYTGDNEKVAREVKQWLDARRERNRLKAAVPVAPSYLPLPTSTEIVALLSYAQTLAEFGLVIGNPGVMKTTTAKFYKASYPNVFMATMEPAKGGVHHVLLELRDVLQLQERAVANISGAIVRRLTGCNALLIIDEAQHLQTKAIDQLRTIHDKAGCGVVLMGNESIVAKLGDPDRAPQLAQLYSRIGLRLVLGRPKKSDVDALMNAWSVTDADERKFLTAVAQKPGALRSLTKTLIAATAMAAGLEEKRGLAHMRDAWGRVGAGEIVVNGRSA